MNLNYYLVEYTIYTHLKLEIQFYFKCTYIFGLAVVNIVKSGIYGWHNNFRKFWHFFFTKVSLGIKENFWWTLVYMPMIAIEFHNRVLLDERVIKAVKQTIPHILIYDFK